MNISDPFHNTHLLLLNIKTTQLQIVAKDTNTKENNDKHLQKKDVMLCQGGLNQKIIMSFGFWVSFNGDLWS